MTKRSTSPKIFADQPVLIAESSKDDGHTSFGHIDNNQTIENINNYLNKLDWPIKGYGFLRVSYGLNKSYDEIAVIKESVAVPKSINMDTLVKADAIVVNQQYMVLLLPTADCLPTTIYDPSNKILALAHLGWHSTTSRLLEKLVTKLAQEFGSKPQDLLCYFGPGIPANYYVHDKPVQLNLPGWKPYLKKIKDGYQIDLLGYNKDQLRQVGVLAGNIEVSPRNTVEDDLLESHHLHSKQGLPTARRYLTVVMMD